MKSNQYNNSNEWFLLRVLSVEIPTWSFQLHSHLNISEWISFGEGFEHVECERTFVLTKWSMARQHHPNHDIIKSLQEARHKTQKQPIYAHLHNTLSQCWGMDGHVLRSTSHEAILRIAVKHLTYIYRYLSRSKKKRFHSTVSYAIWFYCSVAPRCFYLSNKPYVVITPWPWCPTCNFSTCPNCKASKNLTTFSSCKGWSGRNAFRWSSNLGNRVALAQKYSTSTHLAWQHLPRLWVSNQKS